MSVIAPVGGVCVCPCGPVHLVHSAPVGLSTSRTLPLWAYLVRHLPLRAALLLVVVPLNSLSITSFFFYKSQVLLHYTYVLRYF